MGLPPHVRVRTRAHVRRARDSWHYGRRIQLPIPSLERRVAEGDRGASPLDPLDPLGPRRADSGARQIGRRSPLPESAIVGSTLKDHRSTARLGAPVEGRRDSVRHLRAQRADAGVRRRRASTADRPGRLPTAGGGDAPQLREVVAAMVEVNDEEVEDATKCPSRRCFLAPLVPARARSRAR